MTRSITARLLRSAFCVAVAAALAGIAFSAPLPPQDSSPPQTREFFTAEHSIHLVMFLLKFDPKFVNSPVTQLMAELVSAKERGVKVWVVLDQNYEFGSRSAAPGSVRTRNFTARSWLEKNGITVHLDDLSTYTHSKALVIGDVQTHYHKLVLQDDPWSGV